MQDVAEARSADMVARHYFDHVDPDGLAPWDHLDAADIEWWGAGEIIALNSVSGIRDAARQAVVQWMNSQGHHDLIMSSTFNCAGVGVALDGGVSYWTVVFIQGLRPDRWHASIASVSTPPGATPRRFAQEGADRRLATGTSGLKSYDIQRRRLGGPG
ncbi:MAG: CAP domain-containing protein [Chloroflexota bacterium]